MPEKNPLPLYRRREVRGGPSDRSGKTPLLSMDFEYSVRWEVGVDIVPPRTVLKLFSSNHRLEKTDP